MMQQLDLINEDMAVSFPLPCPAARRDERGPTLAQRRVLFKAASMPVMIYGAFSGTGGGGFDIEINQFDRRATIERCIASGWLAPAEGFNQYAITDKGRAAITKRGRGK